MKAKEDGVKLQLVNTGAAELEAKGWPTAFKADSVLAGNILITQPQDMNQRTLFSDAAKCENLGASF